MKKSGKTNRAEPIELNWIDKFLGCAELFENAGWLNLFKNIDGYNTEVSHKFGQCYNQDTVSFDTMKFKLTVELMAKAIGVNNEGELRFKKVPFTFNAQTYLFPDIVPYWSKGVLIQNFRDECVDPIKVLQSYITY